MISTEELSLLPNINELKNNCLSLACLFILFTSENFYLNDNTFIYTGNSTEFFIIYFNKNGAFIYGYDRDSVISTVNYSEDSYAKPWEGLYKNVPIEFHDDIKKVLIHTLSFDKPDYETNLNEISFSDYKLEIGKDFDENKTLQEFINDIWEIINSQTTLNYFYPRLTYLIWRTNEDNEWKSNLYNFDENDNLKDGSKELSILESNKSRIYKLIDKYVDINYDKEKIDKKEFLSNDSRRFRYKYINLKILEDIYSHKPIGNKIIKEIRPYINQNEINIIKSNIKRIGYPIL